MIRFSESSDWQQAVVALGLVLFLQTSVVLAIALTAARIFRGKGPHIRSAILRTALVAMIVCPLVSGLIRLSGMPGLRVIPAVFVAGSTTPDPQAIAVAPTDIFVGDKAPLVGLSRVTQAAAVQPVSGISRPGVLRTDLLHQSPLVAAFPTDENAKSSNHNSQDLWLIAIWSTVVALLLVRIGVANILIAIVRHRAVPAHHDLQQRCTTIAGEIGVKPPPILIACGISGPCLVGSIRAAILLPNDAVEVDREILIHELAHLARRDCAWQLIARIAVAALWFQPLIWIWARALEQAAEEACDNAVIAHNGNRAAYASRLADLAEHAQRRWATASAGVGVVGIRSSAGRRIARILNATSQVTDRLGTRARAGVMLAALLLALGLGGLRSTARQLAHADEPKVPKPVDGHLHGRVLGAGGKPVKGATVFAVQQKVWDAVILESTHPDAEGNFELERAVPNVITGKIELQAFAPGMGLIAARFKPTDSPVLRLKPSTRVLLKVVDAKGTPISGLTVYPLSFIAAEAFSEDHVREDLISTYFRVPPEIGSDLDATTGADGVAIFKDLPRGMKFNLGFDDERYAYPPVMERIEAPSSGAVNQPVTAQLFDAGTVSGVVRYGPTGKPAAEITVYAQGINGGKSYGSFSAVTDSKGAYQIHHILHGDYNVMLHLEGDTERDWTADAHEHLTVDGKQHYNSIDFSLIKGAIVTGRVLTADTGKPIAKAHLVAHGPAHPESSGSVSVTDSAADGTYRLRVPPGAQQVFASAYEPIIRYQSVQIKGQVSVIEGQTATLDLKIPAHILNPVTGVVLGLDGKPAANIQVQAEPTRTPFNLVVLVPTDATGRFHLDDLPPGSSVAVTDGELYADRQLVEKNTPIKLQLHRRVKLTLHGQVTDAAGAPLAGVAVTVGEWLGASGNLPGVSATYTTDTAGQYVVSILHTDSNYVLSAVAEGKGDATTSMRKIDDMNELPTLKLK